MDWYKLSDREIVDFLLLYNKNYVRYQTFSSKVAAAEELFEEISKQGGKVTQPVHDLYAAFLHKNDPRRYIYYKPNIIAFRRRSKRICHRFTLRP